MKILFVHQNFPGQYRQIIDWLIAQGGHEMVFLTQREVKQNINGIKVFRYQCHHKPAPDAYALTRYYEECMGNGFGAVEGARLLKKEGFDPDIIVGHMGWGELTFMKHVWPDVPVVGYFEYFFLAEGGSVGFDPEYPVSDHVPFIMHARNAVNWMSPEFCDLGQTPTKWQHDTFPKQLQKNMYVCHDGIRTDRLTRDETPEPLTLGRSGVTVKKGDEVFTYMARNMEPTRGFHTFMRALPKILEARPNARALIIGGNEVSYGRASDQHGGYRAEMEKEVGDLIDWSRVHFLGMVPYPAFQQVIQISQCHIYLTVPFVLSWSLLETMSMEATIVASDTAPVREVMKHGKTGLLVDFFSPDALAQQVVEVLEDPEAYRKLGKAARAHVVRNFDFLDKTVGVHLRKMNSLLPKSKQFELPKKK